MSEQKSILAYRVQLDILLLMVHRLGFGRDRIDALVERAMSDRELLTMDMARREEVLNQWLDEAGWPKP